MKPSVLELRRYPVKSMGGESLGRAEVSRSGLVHDREWAVYDAEGKLASGKHSRRFRRMDPVFDLVAAVSDGVAVVVLPDGARVRAGDPEADAALSTHFGEPVRLRRAAGLEHQDAGEVSLVGTATLRALGAHEGDGRPLDPRHLRANLVIETDEPYAEESWGGRDLAVGGARLRVSEPIERCRMVGIAQVGLVERPGMLQAISEHHHLLAGLYLNVVTPGEIALGDGVTPL